LNGTVILYADVITDSMRQAMDETNRRREVQERFNLEHGITPRSVTKALEDPLVRMAEADYVTPAVAEERDAYRNANEIRREIDKLRKEMRAAAERLDFERAAELRDRARRLEAKELGLHG
jgi:excinuclease ABC subunit B